MKRKITIIVLIIALATLTTGCFSPKPWFLDLKKTYNVNEEKVLDVSDSNFENIELKLVSDNIRILKSDNSQGKIVLSGSIKSNFTPDIYTQYVGKTLEIRDSNKTFNNSNYTKNNLDFVLYLPEELYKNLSIDTITGNITIDGINFKDLKTDNISGSTKINTIESSNLKMNSVSGKIEIYNSSIFSISTDTVSGSNKLENVNTKSFDFKSVSGSLESQGNFESFKGDTVSGDIYIDTSMLNDDYMITTVSGDVDLNLSKISDFNFRFNSLSGEIETERNLNFDRIHNDTVEGSSGNGGSLINIKTTSGDLIIQ